MSEESIVTKNVANELNGKDFSHIRGEGWRGSGRVHAQYIDFSGDRIKVTVTIEVYRTPIDNTEVGTRIGHFINHWIDGYFLNHPKDRARSHPRVELVIKKA